MSNIFTISFLNSVIIIGMVIAAVCVVVIDDVLPCIIAASVVGTFMALEFLLLRAPDVAIAEGAVGAVLTPVIFIIALAKVNKTKAKENKGEK
ncbi:hydrogenase subunit MbhD domain-containing protein [Clostridium sp. JN-9]|uniref:Na(+)/H(+) antiporter subunit B n=1 Tax=Clostridium sp. JN-9 TaxID=2507159 RepID=UPI001FAAA7E1|nr:hydrogenase subunit MbhD domain-containing protein [Clostridium sp. JN-9]